jgi:hypothetical protein
LAFGSLSESSELALRRLLEFFRAESNANIVDSGISFEENE